MKNMYRMFDKVTDKIGHPTTIIYATALQIVLFFVWVFTGFETLYYEIFHIILAIITLVLALIIESSEKADTKAIQIKLDEIIKNMPQLDNKKIGIEKKIKEGKEM